MSASREPTKLWPHPPSAKQWDFLDSPAPEILYGGAAGGGKSDAILFAASRYVIHPSWHALVIRKTFADLNLPGALLDRARSWWLGKPGVTYHAPSKRFTWDGGGSISFGYLDTAQDHQRYQGAEFTLIAYDEASQLRPEQMTYLASRIRKQKGVDLPLQLRYASNPGGIAHDFLKQRFIESDVPDERLFIPAFLDDNPGLDAEAYRKQLALLDPVTRAQLEHGNWDVQITSGWILIDRIAIRPPAPPDARRIRVWDLASGGKRTSDYTAGVLLARDWQNQFTIEDMQRGQWLPADNERVIAHCAREDPEGTVIYIELEPGASGKANFDHYARNVLSGYHVRSLPATGDKQSRAAPLSAAVANGIIRIVKADWNRALLDELNAFPQGVHDDQVDALAHAYATLSQRPPQPNWEPFTL